MMNIYLAHSTKFDFQQQLYLPVQNSKLFKDHRVVFPHQDSLELFNSKDFFTNDCDLVIAEISFPSTGMGIELGWADSKGIKIIGLHLENIAPSKSAESICLQLISYNPDSLGGILNELSSSL